MYILDVFKTAAVVTLGKLFTNCEVTPSGKILFLSPHAYEEGEILVVGCDKATVVHPFSHDEDVDVSEAFFANVEAIKSADSLHGESALRRFAEICSEQGSAGFSGVELPTETVMATILWQNLLSEGYSWESLNSLRSAAYGIGEDSVICPSGYVEAELESAIWEAAGWAA